MSESFAKVKTSHKFTGDTQGLKTYYNNWATNYNRDLADQKWVCPEVTCEIVAAVAVSYFGALPILLDAGCGTGLLGEKLKQRGFLVIDGVDLSEAMVANAEATRAYRNLQGGINLNEHSSISPQIPYDIVVSSGMFTHGHAEPRAIHSLLRYCHPGGIVIASTRNSYAMATGFEEHLKTKVLGTEADLMFCFRDARYIEEELGAYWVLRRRL